MGKLYNTAYNALARVDSTMRNLGKPKVDAVTSAAPTAAQAIKKDPSIAYKAAATSKGIPTVTSGPLINLPTVPGKDPSKKKRTTRRYSSGGGSSGSGGSHSTSAKEEFHYYEAPLAKMYGFSPETAYQEALANTEMRREMDDMRKAGLNPSVIYGSHNTSGASSSIYPNADSSSGSGGGGGGYRRRSGKSNSGKYLFSGGAYYGAMAAVGTTVALVTKNVGAGMAAAGLTGTAMKALNGVFKKR